MPDKQSLEEWAANERSDRAERATGERSDRGDRAVSERTDRSERALEERHDRAERADHERQDRKERIEKSLRITAYGYARLLWHDLMPALAIGVAFLAVTINVGNQAEQREGRLIALKIVCAAQNATIKQGEKAILGRPELQTPKENELRKQYADEYRREIVNSIEDAYPSGNITDSNGLLDCEEFTKVSRTQAK